jgi:hypothetical protein
MSFHAGNSLNIILGSDPSHSIPTKLLFNNFFRSTTYTEAVLDAIECVDVDPAVGD